MDYSPNAGTVGVEVMPARQGEMLVAGSSAAAVRFTSTGAQTIDDLSIYLAEVSPDLSRLMVEIYDAGDETLPDSSVSSATFRPNADLLNQGNGWLRGSTSGGLASLGTTDLYQRVDDVALDVDNWIAYQGARARRLQYRFTIDTAAWPADRRVVGGRVRLHLNRQESTGRLDVFYFDGTRGWKLGSVVANPKRRYATIRWPELNPATRLPWTRAEIQNLDGPAGLFVRPVNVGRNKLLRVYSIDVRLDYVAENRLAVGAAFVDEGDSFSWVTFPLRRANSATTNWPKGVAGNRYTIVVRRIAGAGWARWRYLEETAETAALLGRASAGELSPVSAFLPTIQPRGFVSTLGDELPERLPAFYLTTSAPATSADSQVYARIFGESIVGGISPSRIQTLTLAGTTYGHVRLLVGNLAGTMTVTLGPAGAYGSLAVDQTRWAELFSLLDTSIRANLLAAGDLLDTGGDDWRIVDFSFDSTGLAAAGAADLEVTLDADSEVVVVGYSTEGADGSASAGGTADEFEGDPDLDLAAAVSTAPAAPADLAAVVDVIDLDAESGPCSVAEAEAAGLSWTATALGAAFARYEIQRRGSRAGDALPRVETIGRPADEATETYRDVEAFRSAAGATNEYRIRVVRTGDYVPSPWSDYVDVVLSTLDADYVIASNHLDEVVAFRRSGGEHVYEWPAEVETVALEGVDGRRVFVEAIDRLDDVELPLLVFAGDDSAPTPSTPGRAMLEPLRAFLRRPVPHWTVVDSTGWRWLGAILAGTATETQPDEVYVVEATLVETQTSPTPTD